MNNRHLSGSEGRCILLCLLAVIFGLCCAQALVAGEHYDEQGAGISEKLSQEFPIPIDGFSNPNHPVKGVYWAPYSSWENWDTIFTGKLNSKIVIYGVKDRTLQDQILRRIAVLKETKVLVVFYDDSRFTAHYDARGNGGASRLPTPILREELLR